ncbi:F-box only protein 7 [Habropoda laboriosa]|uniref:F-box only protein 7 n=1 Tax=Habropoda laboriosa TaxID=597456 RepID=A0A0L7R7H8_9HYME|nr:F-box only protein 7 [Habropoda laboriosa]
MLTSDYAENSTNTQLTPLLEEILGELEGLNQTISPHDYIIALAIVLLNEADFHICTKRKRALHIPKNWKSEETSVYEMCFYLKSVSKVQCKLVAIPLEGTLILNFFPLMEGKRTYSLTVDTLRYYNTFANIPSKKYKNLKEISHRFKDALSTPVRSDVLISAGLTGPSLQAIPTELKFKILGMLDVYSLTRMAQCCSEFNVLCSEPQLWKQLLHRDFPQFSCKTEDSKDSYRTSVRIRNNRRINGKSLKDC